MTCIQALATTHYTDYHKRMWKHTGVAWTCVNQQDITPPSPGSIGMEKLIGLHMDELLLIRVKETSGRKWQRLAKCSEGIGQGKWLAEAQKQGINLWRKKAKVKRRGGGRKGRKRGKSEQVLIGERPGSECQQYLLSQRGLRCEACLSRGP